MIHSYELNLAANDSPIKIIRHHHPVTQREIEIDSTLKVIKNYYYIATIIQ